MVLGIASSVEGNRDVKRSLRMWAAHVGGAVVGGAGVALVVWLALTPLRTFGPGAARFAMFTLLVAVTIGIDSAALVPASRRGRQVPATWLARHGPTRAYAAYGGLLGGGLLTFVPYAVSYTTFAAAGIFAPLGVAILAGALFGGGRAGIVGPAALAAGFASRALFRAKLGHRVFPKLSVMLLSVLWLDSLQTVTHVSL